jgi:hypothetical protein
MFTESIHFATGKNRLEKMLISAGLVGASTINCVGVGIHHKFSTARMVESCENLIISLEYLKLKSQAILHRNLKKEVKKDGFFFLLKNWRQQHRVLGFFVFGES